MKSYLDLVSHYSKAHRSKNRITLLCIISAVCLVTTIFGMADMAIRAQIESTIQFTGNFHAASQSLDDATAQMIAARPDVAVSGWTLSAEDTEYGGKPLSIIGNNADVSAAMGLTVTNGHFPETTTEALMDESALEQFGLKFGDTVEAVSSDGSPLIFTLCGTFKDFSSLKTTDAHGVVFNEKGLRQLKSSKQDGLFIIQFKNGTNMRAAIDDLKHTLNLSDQQLIENTRLLSLYGYSSDPSVTQLYLSAFALFLLVLFAGTIMITNSFNITISERLHFFGLLRCLGASKSQIRRYVLKESFGFSLKAIPIGLISGTLLTWIASAGVRYFNPAFFSEMPLFQFSGIGLISGTITCFLTVLLASMSPCKKASQVSPLCAVTGNTSNDTFSQNKKAALTTPFHIETALGIQHAFSNKKNLALMTASFAISIILFLCFSVCIDFMYQALKPLKPQTPDLSIVSNEPISTLSHHLEQQIAALPEVKKTYGRMMARDISVNGSKANLISYEDNQFEWAKDTLTAGDINSVKNNPNQVLAVYNNDLNQTIGDPIDLQFSDHLKTVEIGGILSENPISTDKDVQTFLCSETAFNTIVGTQNYAVINIQLDKNTGEETVQIIRDLAGSGVTFSDQRQSNSEARAAFNTIAVFVYGFLFIIALITVFNIFNIMNTSVSSRINQYGIMRAVGMSRRQLQKMIIVESGVYSIFGCITGILFGIPLNVLLFRQMITNIWGLPWKFPIIPLLIIIILSLLATLISTLSPVRKIQEMDIVNVINQ